MSIESDENVEAKRYRPPPPPPHQSDPANIWQSWEAEGSFISWFMLFQSYLSLFAIVFLL